MRKIGKKKLDKNSAVPLYVQLYQRLKELIRKGDYKEGDLFPSEKTLMNDYQTTRGTVRKAISELVKDGLVYQVQGKGTYVCFRKVHYSMWNFGGFTDFLRSRNETPVSKVLERGTVTQDGSVYFKLVRARGVNKDGKIQYLTIDTSLLPIALFPNIEQYDFAQESLYHIMREKYQIDPSHAEIRLLPTTVSEEVRRMLQVEDGQTALLKAEGKVLSKDNVEIEKVAVIYSPEIEFKLMTSIR
mgnify:CR=1 FL=1